MKLPDKRLLMITLVGLLITAGLIGLWFVGKEDKMSTKVMMYYGPWSLEDNRFDATRWFSNGMYRLRIMGAPPEPSVETMLRNKPLPIPAQMNEDLVAIAGVALRYQYPDVNTESLIFNPPALSHRVRYCFSSFKKPDMPVDEYNIFLNLGAQRFVIRFSRDAQTGELIHENSAKLVDESQESDAADVQMFKELDEAEQRQS